MRYKKNTKVLCAWLMRILVFVFLGPLAVLYYCNLRCGLAVQIRNLKGKRLSNKAQTSAKRLSSSRDGEMMGTEELDFKRNRARTYIQQINFGTLWEISELACGRQRIHLVPNYALHHVLFNSVFSYGLVREENPQSEVRWRFSFNKMGQYKLFREFHWDVAEILILKTGKLHIRDRTGKIHTPRCKTWTLAKAHVQAQLTAYAPGLAHNPAHYVLPSMIACEVRKLLPETSALRQLLEPHTRFTQYINYKAMKEEMQSFNSRPFYDRLLRPWLSLPTADAEVLSGKNIKCEKYNTEDSPLIPLLDDDIPYQSFLKDYYQIFHDFVSGLSPLLKSDYEILRTAMIERVPSLSRENMVDVISGVLFNSCIVHHCDHESYLKQWARIYGCMAVRKPLVKPRPEFEKIAIETISDGKMIPDATGIKSIHNGATNSHVVVQMYQYDSKKEGLKYFNFVDVCRTRCFIRTFVQYNENPKVNMKLFDTEYGFSDPAATKTTANFFIELKDLSRKLKQRGEAIVKGEDFIRSVCY